MVLFEISTNVEKGEPIMEKEKKIEVLDVGNHRCLSEQNEGMKSYRDRSILAAAGLEDRGLAEHVEYWRLVKNFRQMETNLYFLFPPIY